MPTAKLAKRIVELTDDNRFDYFQFDAPGRIVKRLKIGDRGIDRNGKEVEKLIGWVEMQGVGQYRDIDFVLSRHDAAVILELAAGWHRAPL